MDIETRTPDREHPASGEQLTLLPTPEVPLRFRLDAATRERGLRHVAELRALLERRRAERHHAATTRSDRSARPTRPDRPVPSVTPPSRAA